MITISAACREALDAGAATYEEIVVNFADGTTMTLDDEIMQGENTFVDGSSADSFPVGKAISRYMTVTLDNSQDQFADKYFDGATLTAYLKVQLTSSTQERILKGTYYVMDPEDYGETIEITAVDAMHKADTAYSCSLTLPQTLYTLVTDACTQTGITKGFNSMTNGSLSITAVPEDMTFRDFFGYAAMAACANARIDNSNTLQFVAWNFSGTYHDLSDYTDNPKLSADDVVITGINVTTGDEEDSESYLYGESGYTLDLTNPLLTGHCQTVATTIGAVLVAQPFRTLEGSLTKGDPTVEFGDIAYSYDRQETQHVTPITDVTYNLFGYTDVKTTAVSPIRGSSRYLSDNVKALLALRQKVNSINTVEDSKNYYLATTLSSGVTRSTAGWTEAVQSISSSLPYLWKYDRIYYSDGTSTPSDPMLIGVWSEGTAGRGISSITEHYALSTSSSSVTGTWSTSVQTMDKTNRYLWNYETITYTVGGSENTAQRVIGVYGEKGDTGTSVSSVTSSKSGTTTTVTVTLSNGTTKSFTVEDGATGSAGASAAWYFGTDLTHTSGAATLPVSTTSGVIVGGMYLNSSTYSVYKCTAINSAGTTATWTYAGNLVDGVIENVAITGGQNLLIRSDDTLWTGISRWESQNSPTTKEYDSATNAIHCVTPTSGVSVCGISINTSSANWTSYVPENGVTYTFSIDLMGSITSGYNLSIGIFYTQGGNEWTRLTRKTITSQLSSSKFTRVSYTFTLPDTRDEGTRIILNVGGPAASFYLKNPKLEIGNASAGWSAAPEDTETRVAMVGQSGNRDTTKPWYKAAELTIDTAGFDYEIIFRVTTSYNQQIRHGRLLAHVYSSNSKTVSAAYLCWLDTTDGITLNNFRLAYDASLTANTVVSLWVYVNQSYTTYTLEVESEQVRTATNTRYWSVIKNIEPGGGEAAITSGYTTINSTIQSTAYTLANTNKTTLDILNTQQGVFNKLTNNSQNQGLFLQNGTVYINFTYARGGTLVLGGTKGNEENEYGIFQLVKTVNNADVPVILMDADGLKLYADDGETTVGALGNTGFYLAGSSYWKYDYEVDASTLYGTCELQYGLQSVTDYDGYSRTLPALSLSHTRSGTKSATCDFHIVNTGVNTYLKSDKRLGIYCDPGTSGNSTYHSDCDLQANGTAYITTSQSNSSSNIYTSSGISVSSENDEAPTISLGVSCRNMSTYTVTGSNDINVGLTNTTFSKNIRLSTNDTNILATDTGGNTTELIGLSSSNNIHVGGTTSTHTNTNIYAGTGGNVNLFGDTVNINVGKGKSQVAFKYSASASYKAILTTASISSSDKTLSLPNKTGTLATSSSDVRIKENIKDSNVNALDLINRIQCREFDFLEEYHGGAPHWKCGIIADELEELDNELTEGGGYFEDGSMNVKSIDTLYLEGYIVKALQELSEENRKLKQRISQLEEAVNDGR